MHSGRGTPLTLGYTGLGLAVLVRAMYSWGLKSSRYLPFIFRSDRSSLLMSPVGTYSHTVFQIYNERLFDVSIEHRFMVHCFPFVWSGWPASQLVPVNDVGYKYFYFLSPPSWEGRARHPSPLALSWNWGSDTPICISWFTWTFGTNPVCVRFF